MVNNKTVKLILASGSPRRKELLTQIGLKFEVIKSDAEEIITETAPDKVVMELSAVKAKAVADNLIRSGNDIEGCFIIGADTIVSIDGNILGKPGDRNSAYKMLKSLSGRTHQVYTGVTIYTHGKVNTFAEKTDVHFYDLSENEINDYIESGEPFDKAGGYGIQGSFAAFVKGIDGDYNNVVGLPVSRLYHELKRGGFYDQINSK